MAGLYLRRKIPLKAANLPELHLVRKTHQKPFLLPHHLCIPPSVEKVSPPRSTKVVLCFDRLVKEEFWQCPVSMCIELTHHGPGYVEFIVAELVVRHQVLKV